MRNSVLSIFTRDKIVGRDDKAFFWVDDVGVVISWHEALPHVLVEIAQLSVGTLAYLMLPDWEFALSNIAYVAS